MIKDLIQKYYKNTCSDRERQEIKQFFQDHPEEIEQYFDESEWEGYTAESLEPNDQTDSFLELLTTPTGSRRLRALKIFKRISIAACILIAFGVSAYFIANYLKNPKVDLASHANQVTSLYAIQSNKGRAIKSFVLPDQSEVLLSPGASVRYIKELNGTKRDVYLTGEAVFRVHKDAKRPFTVYCREVATTALGTVFRVQEKNNNTKVAVTLLEGKILVRSTDKKTADNENYYLLPGNEISYSRVDKQFSVVGGKGQTKDIASKRDVNTDIIEVNKSANINRNAPEMAVVEKNQAVQFNDVGLAQVLELLADKRRVKIAFPTNRVGNIKFIGTISDNTPIEKVLSDIAAMNDLKVTKDTLNNKFIIQ